MQSYVTHHMCCCSPSRLVMPSSVLRLPKVGRCFVCCPHSLMLMGVRRPRGQDSRVVGVCPEIRSVHDWSVCVITHPINDNGNHCELGGPGGAGWGSEASQYRRRPRRAGAGTVRLGCALICAPRRERREARRSKHTPHRIEAVDGVLQGLAGLHSTPGVSGEARHTCTCCMPS